MAFEMAKMAGVARLRGKRRNPRLNWLFAMLAEGEAFIGTSKQKMEVRDGGEGLWSALERLGRR